MVAERRKKLDGVNPGYPEVAKHRNGDSSPALANARQNSLTARSRPDTRGILPMNKITLSFLAIGACALVSCKTAETAVKGTANTVGNAATGVVKTGAAAGGGALKTVGNTATTAGSGIVEGDLKKSTVGTVKAAGQGTGSTVVNTGTSAVKTTGGVIKDTGTTVKDTTKAATGQ